MKKYLILIGTAIIFVAVLAYNDYASRKAIMNQVAENARNITRSTVYEINMIRLAKTCAETMLDGPVEVLPARMVMHHTSRQDRIRLGPVS